MEIFWRTIAYYNSATWLLQIVIILIGIVLTALLICRPRPWVKMGMKFYMIGLYSWISVIYYYIYCEERSYNGVMAMFWGVMAIIWIWDTITGYTTFERTHKYDILSYILLAMPFIYPLVSLARGLDILRCPCGGIRHSLSAGYVPAGADGSVADTGTGVVSP